MRFIDLQSFQDLVNYSHEFCISLYLPSDEVGLQAPKRRAEIQHLEQEVESKLKRMNISDKQIEQIKQRVEDLKNLDDLWAVGPKTFAIFISPESSDVFHLPLEMPRLLSISSHFHVKPLLRVLSPDCQCYVLSLTKNNVELFCGNRYELKKIDLPELEKSFEDIVGVEDERNLQSHAGSSPASGGGETATFHGQSSWKDDKHKLLERFLKHVDTVVSKYLQNNKESLILSGVERMITSYHNVNSYPHVMKEIVLKGNTESVPLTTLHQELFDQLEPLILTQEQAEVEQVLQRGNTSQFSFDIPEIVRQASLGRVNTVLVSQDVQEWGSFDPKTCEVVERVSDAPPAEDLLDVACLQTITHGGKAFVLPSELMPGQASAVAIFRY